MNEEKTTLPNFSLTKSQKYVIMSATTTFAQKQDCENKAKQGFQVAQKTFNGEALTIQDVAILKGILAPYKSLQGEAVGKKIFNQINSKI